MGGEGREGAGRWVGALVGRWAGRVMAGEFLFWGENRTRLQASIARKPDARTQIAQLQHGAGIGHPRG